MDTIRLPKSAISLFVLLSFLATERSAAQSTTTSNAFIAADVENASGIITIYIAGISPKELLTYPGFSYITVQVGGDYYTNNPNGATDVEPSGSQVTPIYLTTEGKTTLLKGAIPGTDTIQTIWQPKGPNAFDIVQDVYPVAGVSSGQIVYKWSIVNRAATALNTQMQFLLDLETAHDGFPAPPPYSTDIPAVTTRDGYNADTWQDISNVPYFLTTEYRTCVQTFPGILGAGFLVDDFAPVAMGLMQPSQAVIVDLKAIATQYLWGYPANMLGTVMGDDDNAILLQWPPIGVFGAIAGTPSMQEIGRGSYGTPPCTPITYGSLDALLLHPDHITWDGSKYVPNHFPVEAIIWNSNSVNTTVSAVATQAITNSITGLKSGPVRVVSPTPIGPSGYSQSHGIRSGGSSYIDSVINECSSSYATWEDTVLANILTNCATDSSYDITLSVSASGVSQPIFGFGLPVCPILVDCQEKDMTPPRHSQHLFSDTNHCGYPMTFRDSIFDNLVTDQGIQSITYTVTPNPTAIEVTGIPPSITGCPSVIGPITVRQIDTLSAACVYFTYTDCAGNVSYDTGCFAACPPPLDTPIIIAGDLNFGTITVGQTVCIPLTIYNAGKAPLDIYPNSLLPDTIDFSFQDLDRLPITIAPGNEINLRFCFHPHIMGPIQTRFVWSTNVPAPFTGQDKDTSLLSGNGTAAGVNSASSNLPFALSISPNPASGVTTISLIGAPSANVEIFDVLGREVANFRVAGSYEWRMGTLPAGTYIVRAASNGAVISRRVVKE